MELKKITREELNEVLEKHKKWLNHEEGGKQANLSGVDLSALDLRRANLSYANLSYASLDFADLKGADLSCAYLRGTDLRGANLRSADLTEADLSGANLDFSCFPLWCGGLDVHIDERQAYQLLYHLLRNVSYSKHISEDLKQKLLTPELVGLANRFHRTEGCGKIKVYKDCK